MYFRSHQNSGNGVQNELSSFYFTSSYAYILPPLSPFGLLMSKEGRKGKGTMGSPTFPFPSMSLLSVYVVG